MDPDLSRASGANDPARPGMVDAFPEGALANPQTSPVARDADPPIPDASGVLPHPVAPTAGSDVPIGSSAPLTSDAGIDDVHGDTLGGGGLGQAGGAVLGGTGGAVAGGVVGAIVAGPLGAVVGGAIGAAAGAMVGDRSHEQVGQPPRDPGDMEEDEAFSGGEYVAGDAALRGRNAAPGSGDESGHDSGDAAAIATRYPGALENRDAGAPGPLAVDADAEERALDDPDDPHLPENREIRP